MDNMAEVFRKKFATYRKLLDEANEKTAWDTVFQGYPERQKTNMGPMIDGTTLTAGFSLAIPNYKKMGMDMVIYDISNNGQDAVLEIQKSCPVLDNGWHTEFGFEKQACPRQPNRIGRRSSGSAHAPDSGCDHFLALERKTSASWTSDWSDGRCNSGSDLQANAFQTTLFAGS